MISHVFDALQIINKIKSTPEFLKITDQCRGSIKAHFEKCARVVGTKDYLLMRAMRNDVSFHYLDATVRSAFASQSQNAPELPLALSVGDSNLHWYYEPGDRIIDSAEASLRFQKELKFSPPLII